MFYTASQAFLKKTLIEAIYTENHAMISQALTKSEFAKRISPSPDTEMSSTDKVVLAFSLYRS